MAEARHKDGWEGFLEQLRAAGEEPAPDVRHRPNKFATHDHEVYAKTRGRDLNQIGYVAELAVKGADRFWPEKDLVKIKGGKMAPRPTSNSALREYRKRCAEVTGISFNEA